MTSSTFIDSIVPQRRVATDLALIGAGSLLIALAAQVALPLPFTPVPVTLQTLAVVLTGAVLGSRRGALAVGAYLLEGLSGMPVFAGGAFGPLAFAGPTAGFLVGFVPAAAVVGWLAERGWDRRWPTSLAAMALGDAVILGAGLLWLSAWMPLPVAAAQAVVPFLAGDLVKLAAAVAALPLAWKAIGRS